MPRLAPLDRGRILDLGCGDGRHLESMRRRGLAVTGLDLSAALLQRARERMAAGPRASLTRGDMRRLPYADGSFAAVLSLFTAFGYFGPLAENRAVVSEVARVLAPGGHWVLDYLDADRVRDELTEAAPSPRRRTVGPLDITESKRIAPQRDQVLKSVVVLPAAGREAEALTWGVGPGGLDYEEQVALFALEEMDALAAAEDLLRVAGAGAYDGRELGTGDRWILVYRRKDD